jgi:hypothetical protein
VQCGAVHRLKEPFTLRRDELLGEFINIFHQDFHQYFRTGAVEQH